MSISRLFNFQGGEFAIADDVDAELDQLVSEINSKPEADGTLQSNLVAQYISNGATNFGVDNPADGGTNKVAICNTTLQENLNADTVDGLHASDFAEVGFPAGTRLLFYQATPPSGWTFLNVGTYDQVLTVKGNTTGTAAGGTGAGSDFHWDLNFDGNLGVTINGTKLTSNQIPPHTHPVTYACSPASGSTLPDIISYFPLGTVSGVKNISTTSSPNVTSDSTHTHTGSIISSGIWRPPRRYCIIATKT